MIKEASSQPSFRSSRVRRWSAYLWRAAILERWRPIAPAFAKPNPAAWSDSRVTAAWLGHATVLINFLGIKILTKKLIRTVACPSQAAVTRESLHAAGFGFAKAGAIGRQRSRIAARQR